jgi:SNF2 family DNA or RNA helicase
MSRELDPRLHGYQRRAVAHLHGTGEKGAGLLLDMGLGKTATVLQALEPRHLPALVAAPRRVAEEVWGAEAAKWRPDLTVARATGTPAARARALASGADVVVMTRDTVSDLGKVAHPFRTLVLDELSGYKNGSTARWRATARVAARASHVWGLTGTPAPNGYEDLYAQVRLLDGGRRLGRTLTEYRDRYFDVVRRHPQTNVVIERAPKPGAVDAVNRLLEDLCLSMRAEDYLDLPPLTLNEVRVEMPPAARRAYADLESTLVADLGVLGGVHTAANAAVLSSRLRQVSAGFLYADGDASTVTRLHDAKHEALREVLDGTGGNVLVFHWFREEADRIMADPAIGAVRVDEPGAVAAWNRGEVRVLLAHPASAGHGLNLQDGGSTVVYTSLDWSLEYWEQSLARLHRQGQRRPVVAHWISAAPIDRVIARRLEAKVDVQDALMSYLREPEAFL